MLTIQYLASSPTTEAAQPPVAGNPTLGNLNHPQGHSRLRLYLVGSEADTQQTVDYLHVRGCIERIEWSHAIAVPDNGIIVRRDPGNVLRYLQRDRQFD